MRPEEPRDSVPERPIDAYRAIIDTLVRETRSYGSASRVVRSAIFSNAPDHIEFNRFIQALPSGQRELLSRMLQDERDGAIHDVLATLSWWVDCRDVALTYKGEPMPVDLSGMGLHGDYVGRRDGWPWPDDTSDEHAS